jgi:pimeloyl-ACP methyl ester carboxylesterase
MIVKSACMPKSLYRTKDGRQIMMQSYDKALEQFPVPVESRLIPTRLGDVHVLIAGAAENPPLFLIHGAASNSTSWLPNIEMLSKHFRVYLLDIPGDGGKSVGITVSRSGQEYVDWLVDVMENLQLEKIHLCGISLGGYISLLMAMRQPQRIERLVVMAPALFLPISLGFITHALMAGVFPTRQTVGKFLRYLSAPATTFDTELHEAFYLTVRHIKPSTTFPAGFREDDLQNIQHPVLFMVGKYEVLYNPHKAITRAKSIFPNVQTQVIPNAGHILTWEQPQLVNQAIIDFLGAAT